MISDSFSFTNLTRSLYEIGTWPIRGSKDIFKFTKEVARKSVEYPRWRNFTLARGGISLISSTVGFFTGLNFEANDNTNFFNYLEDALPVAFTGLATRIPLELIGGWFVYSPYKGAYKPAEFVKNYFKAQWPFYIFDAISSPVALAGIQYIGVPKDLSPYLNGKVFGVPLFLLNAYRYKKIVLKER